MTDRELMQMALEALESVLCDPEGRCCIRGTAADRAVVDGALTALRERLAQPEQTPLDRMAENAREMGLDYEPAEHTKKYVAEQEPVAWLYRDSWGAMKLAQVMPPPVSAFPVYTTPPRREWVGLDRKEMLAIIDQQQASKQTGLPMFYRDQCLNMARAIETKLKEKNA